MRVKKNNIFQRNSTFFQHSFQTQSFKSLIERMFLAFLCLLCKDSEKSVHFGFKTYSTDSILALASSTSELLMERR